MSESKEVVCKFRFVAMRTAEGYDFEKKQPTLLYDLEFVPVSRTSEENKKFWQATPSGLFKFSTVNAEAAKMFQFGHEYYVTFREAPAPSLTNMLSLMQTGLASSKMHTLSSFSSTSTSNGTLNKPDCRHLKLSLKVKV